MALGCVRDSGRRIYLPVVSEFDQGGGSGVDEHGTSNPGDVPVFLPWRKGKKSALFLPAQNAHFSLFYHGGKGGNRAFFTCAKSAIFGGHFSLFLRCYQRRNPAPILTVSSLIPVKKIDGAMVQGINWRDTLAESKGVS
jgi:hypothetical protein